jgi:hypothetical protein
MDLQRLLQQYQMNQMSAALAAASNNLRLSTAAPLSPRGGGAALAVERSNDSLLEQMLALHRQVAAATAPPPPPIQAAPIFTPMDRSRCQLVECGLEGERIIGFLIGGEERLLLPHIVGTILKEITGDDLQRGLSELNIHCQPCSLDQLELLKVHGVIPMSTSSCNLIKKTDAQRLCSHLLQKFQQNSFAEQKSDDSNSVGKSEKIPALLLEHCCFGQAKGRFYSERYSDAGARCIECVECGLELNPERFVTHGHRSKETRTCHWGFDAANWRAYVHLPREIELDEDAKDRLRMMKAKFSRTGGNNSVVNNSVVGMGDKVIIGRKREVNHLKNLLKNLGFQNPLTLSAVKIESVFYMFLLYI